MSLIKLQTMDSRQSELSKPHHITRKVQTTLRVLHLEIMSLRIKSICNGFFINVYIFRSPEPKAYQVCL